VLARLCDGCVLKRVVTEACSDGFFGWIGWEARPFVTRTRLALRLAFVFQLKDSILIILLVSSGILI
jgi:hypothetical protein